MHWHNMFRTAAVFKSLVNYKGLVASTKRFCVIQSSKGCDKPKNPLGIQMLPEYLHCQIFEEDANSKGFILERENAWTEVVSHLKEHNIDIDTHASDAQDICFDLPTVHGSLEDHILMIANQQVYSYKNLAEQLVNANPPTMPLEWSFKPGWTKYTDGVASPVQCPEEDAFVLDVEVCVKDSDRPVLATAVSDSSWYSWVSKRLTTSDEDYFASHGFVDRHYCKLGELINVHPQVASTDSPSQLIVGHNVSYDRARIREEYSITGSTTRFLDTLSLHVCVAGLTTTQKLKWLKSWHSPEDNGPRRADSWMAAGVPNSLEHVYRYYCGGSLSKEMRDVFVKGNVEAIRENFQNLMQYCAEDSLATLKVFQQVYPRYLQCCPHPATLSGMIEMGSCFLPTSKRWRNFIQDTSEAFEDLDLEMKAKLMKLADEACSYADKYHDHPWYSWLDWTTKQYRGKRSTAKQLKSLLSSIQEPLSAVKYGGCLPCSDSQDSTFKLLPVTEVFPIQEPTKLPVHMPGMPQWYRAVCERRNKGPSFQPGPMLLSAQTMISPYLLRMAWKDCPLYHHPDHGWGYLEGTSSQAWQPTDCRASYETLGPEEDVELDVDLLVDDLHPPFTDALFDSEDDVAVHRPEGEQSLVFRKLPHKNGPKFNVGNPLAKDFQGKLKAGILTSQAGSIGQRILQLSSMLSFWRISKDRIHNQFIVWYDEHQTQGAILPKLITAGTATRRAVESTWLTASNAQEDRVGSELKTVIEAPPGYCLVGADVDSQELWIASLLGDANFAGEHGCTALGWMTLQGSKTDGTDLHSVTARNIGINRQHAKILNYGRLYGAGKPFAELLLQQYNPSLTSLEAGEKAALLYQTTKGSRRYVLNKRGMGVAGRMRMHIASDRTLSQEEMDNVSRHSRCRVSRLTERCVWSGGSESFTFNKLESIANSSCPTTPVLGNKITQALRPGRVGTKFLTSRINWVVQSSAVDYLHLLLICTKWMFEQYSIQGRLCLSIHDEVRYLVKSEDKYRAAMALQVANLWTRCMFASRLGIPNLPLSVAFFSAVDIDHVLRKEVNMDCRTPSNRLGLARGHKIPFGEALDIHTLLQKTNNGNDMYTRPCELAD